MYVFLPDGRGESGCHPNADRKTIVRHYNGLAAVEHSKCQRPAWITHLARSHGVFRLTKITLQVDSGTECSACAGQDDDFDPIIRIDGRKEGDKSIDHFPCDRI